MIISRTALRLDAPEFPRPILEEIGKDAFESAELAAREFIRVRPLGTEVELTEGSLGVVAGVIVTASALINFLNGYAGFWEGVGRLKEQGQAAGRFFRGRLGGEKHLKSSTIVTSRISTADLGRLDRLHREVAENRISPDDALKKAAHVLKSAGENVDDKMLDTLSFAFRSIPPGSMAPRRLPSQGRAEEGAPNRARLPTARRPRRRLIMRRPPDAVEPESEYVEE